MHEVTAQSMLDLAARIASRAAGDVEPNPMVGAVVVKNGRIIGIGHHRMFGGFHAEREALLDCGRRGEDPRGATIYVTLEPCSHVGKQPPCTEALIEAGIARVIAARSDPNPISGGGAMILRRAGIPCDFCDASRNSLELSAPFIKRITTGLPWVIAKLAQTVDGRLVTRPDEPRWISGEVSRRSVHRLRARVDAVITGIGTVLADDPLLTARRVPRVRRIAKRVVIDPRIETPITSRLVESAAQAPLVVFAAHIDQLDAVERGAELRRRGIRVHSFPSADANRCDLRGILRHLASTGMTNVLLECGPRLLASMLDADLIDAAVVYIGSARLGEAAALAAVKITAPAVADPGRFELRRVRRSGVDTEVQFRRARES